MAGADGARLGADEALEQIAYLKRLVDETRFRLSGSYPMFFMWGAIWAAGYLGSAWLEEGRAGVLWTILVSVGAVASMVIGRALSKAGPPSTSLTRGLFRMNIALVLAFVAVIPNAFIPEITHDIRAAYAPFAVGFIYVLNGIFLGWELVAIGGFIVATSLVSFAMGSPLKEFWMAGVGGGGLLVTGVVLLRQQRAGR